MEKRSRNLWLIVLSCIIIYGVLVLYGISSNKQKIQESTYDDWYHAYVIETTNGAYVNAGTKTKKVALSESQGYGMVITALAAKKGYATEARFDRLMQYYFANRRSATSSLMKWKQTTIDDKWQSVDNNNATDGDLDIAYSFILAAKLWPDNAASYKQAASDLLADIKAENYNAETGVLTVGNWATEDQTMRYLFRSSDVMPVYFEEFARFTNDSFWTTLEETSAQKLLTLSSQHKTGLLPDFAWVTPTETKAVKAKTIATKNDGNYGYNSARMPLRLANSSNATIKKVQKKLLDFFRDQPIVYGGYTLKGKALVDYQSASFSAPILYATNRKQAYSGLHSQEQWVYKYDITGKEYYGDTLKTLVLLQLY